jgi:hypothetical protein
MTIVKRSNGALVISAGPGSFSVLDEFFAELSFFYSCALGNVVLECPITQSGASDASWSRPDRRERHGKGQSRQGGVQPVEIQPAARCRRIRMGG